MWAGFVKIRGWFIGSCYDKIHYFLTLHLTVGSGFARTWWGLFSITICFNRRPLKLTKTKLTGWCMQLADILPVTCPL